MPWAEIVQLCREPTFSGNIAETEVMYYCWKPFWLLKKKSILIFFPQINNLLFLITMKLLFSLCLNIQQQQIIFHLFQNSFKMLWVDIGNPDVFNSENWEIDFEQESYLIWCASSGRRMTEHSPVLCYTVIYIKMEWKEFPGICALSWEDLGGNKESNTPHSPCIFSSY